MHALRIAAIMLLSIGFSTADWTVILYHFPALSAIHPLIPDLAMYPWRRRLMLLVFRHQWSRQRLPALHSSMSLSRYCPLRSLNSLLIPFIRNTHVYRTETAVIRAPNMWIAPGMPIVHKHQTLALTKAFERTPHHLYSLTHRLRYDTSLSAYDMKYPVLGAAVGCHGEEEVSVNIFRIKCSKK